MENEWQMKALGRAAGKVECGEKTVTVDWTQPHEQLLHGDEITVHSAVGKLADSQENLLFCYVKIDPRKFHFRLKASFEVTGTELCPDYQTGYGIYVCDTDYSAD